MRRPLSLGAAALAVTGFALFAYRNSLFSSEVVRYPWGSDTWGHLIKVQYLAQELAAGKLYPEIFPGWYAGMQIFRYYAPLPYYLLLGLFGLVGDIFLTAGWFVFLCALLGGLSFLLFERLIGLHLATLGAVLFTLLPDNVRVAYAEGNLPRTLAVALLPLTFYCLLRVMAPTARSKPFILPLTALVSLIILSHAMMGAIFFACLLLFSIVYWLLGGSRFGGLFRALFGLGAGLLLSGWWLFPSLTGGITELSQSAVGEALASFPVSISFNPFLRSRDPEVFYLGLGLGLGAVLALLLWRRLDPLVRAVLLTGLATTLITTSFINPIYVALPFNHLFWPIRFASFIGFILLLSLLLLWRHSRRWSRGLILIVFLVVGADFWQSTALIHGRPADLVTITAAERINSLTGWRVATADLSRLGSGPSYWLSQAGNREQVYGWGYQGAHIAADVANINYAMDRGYSDFAIDRMEQLGVDDVLLLRGVLHSSGFEQRLKQAGFRAEPLDSRLTLYHKDGGPRAFVVGDDVLGIGAGAQNLALIFPRITTGDSPRVDAYDPRYLARFKTLVLSRFSWNDKGTAERIVANFARQGGRVLIDLTGAPSDIQSRQPKFLGVYGEPLQFVGHTILRRDGRQIALLPFLYEGETWQANNPQGLDEQIVTFDYAGQEAAALGYKDVGDGRVWFTGLNLPFHAVLTGDPVASQLLSDVLGILPKELPRRQAVPLRDYQAGEGGYTFSYRLEEPGQIVIPVAAHEGFGVLLDGNLLPSTTIDDLVAFDSPAGTHDVRVFFNRGRVYFLGLFVTALGLLMLIAYVTGLAGLLIRRYRQRARPWDARAREREQVPQWPPAAIG